MLKKMIILASAALVMIISQGCATSDIRAVRKQAMRTYTYKTTDEVEIKVDVYPQPRDGRAKPVIMWIHGGALIKGNRNPMAHDDFWDMVWERGYIIASYDYRLAPETKLAGIIEDIKDGYKWLRENGPVLFEADVERIAVAGESAGGYLTRLTGYHYEPRPKALISLYGYGNIIGDWYAEPDPFYSTTRPAVSREQAYRGIGKTETTGHDPAQGRTDFYYYCRQKGYWPQAITGIDPQKNPEKYGPYLPIKNITPEYPPIFLAHSPTDTDVPYSESRNMTVELKKAGVDFEFVTVSGGHSFKTADKKELDKLYKKMADFLDDYVKGANMKPTITSGKHFANHCKMTGSRFEDVCLGGAEFDNVSLAGAKFHNINFSDTVITAANFGGATFRHIGPTPNEADYYPPQKPVLFSEADFNGSKFEKVNLANVEINDCNIDGLKVDGILLSDLIREYKSKRD